MRPARAGRNVTSMSVRRPLAVLTLLLLHPLLTAADGCPITLGTGSGSGSGSGGGSGSGSGAALQGNWRLTYASTSRATLRSGTQTASANLTPSDGPTALLGRTLHLRTFCWRTDVVCPEQVLPTKTVIASSSSDTDQVVVSFNRKGPLTYVKQQGLVGDLDGDELDIPLGMNKSKTDPCTLAVGSAVVATASASAEDDSDPDTLSGLVTVRYGGTCVSLGGNGAAYDSDELEIATQFSASKQ